MTKYFLMEKKIIEVFAMYIFNSFGKNFKEAMND